MANNNWTPLEPKFNHPQSISVFCTYASILQAILQERNQVDALSAIEEYKRKTFREGKLTDPEEETAVRAALLSLTDLARQGWKLRVTEHTVEISQPESLDNHLAEKQRVRSQLHLERDEQLRKPPVRTFVQTMERRRLCNDRFVSIFSLMRDGEELARKLRTICQEPFGEKRVSGLRDVIQPYIEFVTEDGQCSWTGLKLQDIWRYFRYTWSLPYRSVPGRTMMILIRDAAVKPHPIIGIAALSSPAVQITVREKWIGWDSDVFISDIKQNSSDQISDWLIRVVNDSINEIYIDDFLEDEILTIEQLKSPDEKVFERLEKEAIEQRKQHHRFVETSEHKNKSKGNGTSDEYWEQQARSHLFRSKRAITLATLLRARRVLKIYLDPVPSGDGLAKMLKNPESCQVVRSIIRKVKGDRVGIAMADIAVCGALPPYSNLLGGKLVSMLLTSPEIVLAYREKYKDSCSIIASSLAGKPIVRSADLVFLGTTSLYGKGSSQYNRIKIPCEVAGGLKGEEVRYELLGHTLGYGSFHFGDETVEAFSTLIEQTSDGQRVNSIFGEGVNPRLRKVRDGLMQLGLPSDLLLNHGSPRVVYGVPLARNFREYLLGIDNTPDYYFPLDQPQKTTQQIAEWWIMRWLAHRIEREETLDQVAKHTFVHPIRHGARVQLPREDTDQMDLFGR